jgi:hypothetical protein
MKENNANSISCNTNLKIKKGLRIFFVARFCEFSDLIDLFPVIYISIPPISAPTIKTFNINMGVILFP